MLHIKTSRFTKIIAGSLLLFSCNQAQNKGKHISSDSISADIKKLFASEEHKITIDTFNIENLIPEYKKDTNFHKISGLQVRTGVQKLYYYSIYRMPKKMVVDNFNKRPKIVCLTSSNGQKTYCECKRILNQYFFNQLYEADENNPICQKYFYRFKKLQDFEIYAYFSPEYMHQIIFDKNSDTVYHRVRDVIY